MRKRLRVALVILLFATLGCMAWVLLQPKEIELVYQGRTLSAWLGDYWRYKGYYAESNAAVDKAVRHIGSNAIPVLIRMLTASDSTVFKLREFGDDHGLHFLRPKTGGAGLGRGHAAMAFHALGADAHDAVPKLIELYKKARIGGEDYLPSVANALGGIGPSASNAIPVLLEVVTNFPTRDDVYLAMRTLGEIHSQPELIIPVFVSFLSSKDTLLKSAAVHELRNYGYAAQSAAAELIPLLNDPDKNVRESVTNTLRVIDPEAAAKLGIR